ncbi:MAG: Flp family type IVb pilin [Hyphomicrobiaceae bacterium]|nr:Flp family type IVb pilin [Hyphomicrobiaceae bacterium]
MKKFVVRFAQDESGATAIEYGLIAAGIGIAILAGIDGVAGALNDLFGRVDTELDAR